MSFVAVPIVAPTIAEDERMNALTYSLARNTRIVTFFDLCAISLPLPSGTLHYVRCLGHCPPWLPQIAMARGLVMIRDFCYRLRCGNVGDRAALKKKPTATPFAAQASKIFSTFAS